MNICKNTNQKHNIQLRNRLCCKDLINQSIKPTKNPLLVLYNYESLSGKCLELKRAKVELKTFKCWLQNTICQKIWNQALHT